MAAFITGVIYIVPLNFVLTNVQDLIDVPSLQPIPLLFKLVVGSPGGAFGLLFLSECHEEGVVGGTNPHVRIKTKTTHAPWQSSSLPDSP